MRLVDRRIIFSPSDLMRFQTCAHASALDLRYLMGEPLTPAQDAPDSLLLQRKGEEHERRHLERLAEKVSGIVKIDRSLEFDAAAALTRAAMAEGAPIIYQGALESGRWQGYSDFLERVEQPSELGGFGYEVVDTKLKHRADPKHAVQLSLYSRAIAEAQGRMPDKAHIELGSGVRVSLQVESIRYYVDRLVERYEIFIEDLPETRPEPVAACPHCRWREHCKDFWDRTDSLTRVAGITRRQRQRLEGADVTTLTALATLQGTVPHIERKTLSKLQTQARLQAARYAGGSPQFELKDIEPGRGLARLPPPSKGDLFFDMEGDPFIQGGFEYLFGIYHETHGNPVFQPRWAHDTDEERKALKDGLAFFIRQIAANPEAHIYHFNHYEVTALKRLTAQYGTGEAALDHLLRMQKFVDLYRVVRQALIISEESYALKDIETFYMDKRRDQIIRAMDSVVAYEQWLETRNQEILDKIAAYNELDCRSIKLLRDWLLSEVRPADLPWPSLSVPPAPTAVDDSERQALRTIFDSAQPRLGKSVADLLFEINSFHRRAARPAWWEFFDRQHRDLDELIEDNETLAGLVALAPPRHRERAYSFPPQETKMRKDETACVRGQDREATILDLHRRRRRVTVKFGSKPRVPPEYLDLIPQKPRYDDVLREAVRRVTENIALGRGRYRAVEDFVARRRPRLFGRAETEPIVPGIDFLRETVDAVTRLNLNCLPIQGPPGTGKTYVGSRAILDLASKGCRIAVSSNSHKAIDNLLLAVAERARERGIHLGIVKKVSPGENGPSDPMIMVPTDYENATLYRAQIVGGTAWVFAREEFDQNFDFLFVDEAGQVSIANLVAMGAAARNIVLIGDQMQLAQPIQGIHPGESGLSSLDYLLAGRRTVGPKDGIFLSVSRRMHPSLCSIVSRFAYDGHLEADQAASNHQINFSSARHPPPVGIAFFEVDHRAANSQSSEEEVEALTRVYETLLDATFTDRHGISRPMQIANILVVSPYNAQVNLLADRLPEGARVGTVDRFQGQEAAVCLISLATSSGDELPRDIEFLFSLNRLNVAISRAKALTVIFCSPRLLDVECSAMEELQLVNALCWIREASAT